MAAIEGELLMNSYFEKLIKRLYEQHRHYENALQECIEQRDKLMQSTSNIDLSFIPLDEYERGKLFEYQEIGSVEYLRELVQAEKDGEEVYRLALDTWGADAQTLMAFEEMSELQKELCKHARGRDNREEISEEIADVLIMLDQMMVLHDCKQTVKEWKERKLKRLAYRLTREEAAMEGGEAK